MGKLRGPYDSRLRYLAVMIAPVIALVTIMTVYATDNTPAGPGTTAAAFWQAWRRRRSRLAKAIKVRLSFTDDAGNEVGT